MSLPKRTTEIPIHGGKDEAKDKFRALTPNNSEVYDCRFYHDGALAKRFGDREVAGYFPSKRWEDEGGGHTLVEHDGRLVILGHDGPYVENPIEAEWAPSTRIAPRPSQVSTDVVISETGDQFTGTTHHEMAIVDVNGRKLACVVYKGIGACRYAWFELTTDKPPVLISGPSAFGTNTGTIEYVPRVAACGNYVMVVGANASGDLVGTVVNATSSYTFPNVVLISSSGANQNLHSLTLVGGPAAKNAFWCVYGISSADYRVSRFTAGSTTIDASQSRTAIALAACYVDLPNERIVVAEASGGVAWFPANLSAGATAVSVVTPVASYVHRASITQADATGKVLVAWSGSGNLSTYANGIGNIGTQVCLLNDSVYTLAWPEYVIGQASLGGHMCWDGSDASPLVYLCNAQSEPGSTEETPYFAGYFARPVEDTGNLNQWSLALVATVGADYFHRPRTWDDNGTPNRQSYMPSIRSVDVGEFFACFDRIDYLGAIARCATVGCAPLRNVSAQGLRMMQAGHGVSYFDGVQVAELTPTQLTDVYADQTDNGWGDNGTNQPLSGAVPQPNMGFSIRWTDNKGNQHRSPIARVPALNWYHLDGSTYYWSPWLIPKPWPCSINNELGQWYVVDIYQSDATDGLLYFMGTLRPEVHPTNDAVDVIVPNLLVVGTPSLLATTRPLAWESNGELLHVPPPAFRDVCTTQDRVWGLNAEKGRLEVWPSKIITEGYAPEFPPDLVVRIPADGGECTAIAALDDKVLVFKERAIFVLFGDPGNNNGERATLEEPRLLSADVGCVNQNSVVSGPFGVVFQTSSQSLSGRGGLHLVTKGLEVQHIGAPAKDTAAGVTFISGDLVPPEKEVRWLMSDGNALVWSYDLDRWHLHRGRANRSATIRRDRWASLSEVEGDTYVYQDSTDFSGDLDLHTTSVTTSWINLADLQSFKRIWQAGFLLRHYTGGLSIEYALDYNETWYTAKTWTEAELDALKPASGNRVQVWFAPHIQKCESIRFRVQETLEQTGNGRGHELISLVLEWGAKRGSAWSNQATSSRK